MKEAMQLKEMLETVATYLHLVGAPDETRKIVYEGMILAFRLGGDAGPEGTKALRELYLRAARPDSPHTM